MCRLLRGAVLAVLAACTMAVPAAAAPTIETTGSATLTVPNDAASLSAGLSITRATPADALRVVGARTRRLLIAIQSTGVAQRDIETSALTVHPTAHRVHHHRVGVYEADSSLQITVRDVARVGEVLQAATRAGATSIDGPFFFLANSEATYENALGQAFAQAKTKAQSLANESGLTLGAPQSIHETSSSTAGGSGQALSAPGTSVSAPPTRPGTTTVEADVDVVFGAS